MKRESMKIDGKNRKLPFAFIKKMRKAREVLKRIDTDTMIDSNIKRQCIELFRILDNPPEYRDMVYSSDDDKICDAACEIGSWLLEELLSGDEEYDEYGEYFYDRIKDALYKMADVAWNEAKKEKKEIGGE